MRDSFVEKPPVDIHKLFAHNGHLAALVETSSSFARPRSLSTASNRASIRSDKSFQCGKDAVVAGIGCIVGLSYCYGWLVSEVYQGSNHYNRRYPQDLFILSSHIHIVGLAQMWKNCWKRPLVFVCPVLRGFVECALPCLPTATNLPGDRTSRHYKPEREVQ